MNNIKLYKLKYFGVEPGEGRSVCYPRLILKGNKILFLTWGIPTADGICIGLYMACIDLFWILSGAIKSFKIKSSSSIWIPYHIICTAQILRGEFFVSAWNELYFGYNSKRKFCNNWHGFF